MGRFTQRPLGAHPRLKELIASLFRAVRGVDRLPLSPRKDQSVIPVTGDDDGVDESE
jgi:hypothetical protein